MKIAVVGLPEDVVAKVSNALPDHSVRGLDASSALEWLDNDGIVLATSTALRFDDLWGATGVSAHYADDFTQWDNPSAVASLMGLSTQDYWLFDSNSSEYEEGVKDGGATPEPEEPTPEPEPAPVETGEPSEPAPANETNEGRPTIDQYAALDIDFEAAQRALSEASKAVEQGDNDIWRRVEKISRDSREEVAKVTRLREEVSPLHKNKTLADKAQERGRRRSPRSQTRTPFEPSQAGYCLLITSGFGGSGKSTLSYFSAHVMQMAFQFKKREQKVILIEADYTNPKLQNRLKIPEGRDLSKLANLLEDHRRQRNGVTSDNLQEKAVGIMDEIMYETEHGFSVIACPYNTTAARPEMIEDAIRKSVQWAQRSMGMFVIVDADVIGPATGVNRDLVEMANSVVIVSDAHQPRVTRGWLPWMKRVEAGDPNDTSHLDDTRSRIQAFTTPGERNGFGIEMDKISVFFNRTLPEEIENVVVQPGLLPRSIIKGNFDVIPSIERGWAGNIMDGGETAIEVARQTAEFLYKTTFHPDVEALLREM